jgi:hypothetical protein
MSSDIASEAAPAGLSGHAFSSLFQRAAGLRNLARPSSPCSAACFVGVIVGGLLVAMTGSLGVCSRALLATVVWVGRRSAPASMRRPAADGPRARHYAAQASPMRSSTV